jgi:hypothetical protein
MATPSSRPCDWTGGSVYTTKDGKFFQVIVDDVTGKITKVKPISEGKDLSHAKSQKAAMDLAKMKLADAASKSMGQAKGPLGMCASSMSCLS